MASRSAARERRRRVPPAITESRISSVRRGDLDVAGVGRRRRTRGCRRGCRRRPRLLTPGERGVAGDRRRGDMAGGAALNRGDAAAVGALGVAAVAAGAERARAAVAARRPPWTSLPVIVLLTMTTSSLLKIPPPLASLLAPPWPPWPPPDGPALPPSPAALEKPLLPEIVLSRITRKPDPAPIAPLPEPPLPPAPPAFEPLPVPPFPPAPTVRDVAGDGDTVERDMSEGVDPDSCADAAGSACAAGSADGREAVAAIAAGDAIAHDVDERQRERRPVRRDRSAVGIAAGAAASGDRRAVRSVAADQVAAGDRQADEHCRRPGVELDDALARGDAVRSSSPRGLRRRC